MTEMGRIPTLNADLKVAQPGFNKVKARALNSPNPVLSGC
jgi:hypothetical protein